MPLPVGLSGLCMTGLEPVHYCTLNTVSLPFGIHTRSTQGGIRTHTFSILNAVPLPLGYSCVSDVRFELTENGV